MKKTYRIISLLLVFSMVVGMLSLLTGCSSENTNKETTEKSEVSTVSETENSKTEKNDEVDLDLTTLSSTMVYSEVYNIMTTPDEYIGKKIKMNGIYTQYTNQGGTAFYPACIIQDATACCSQGIEFVLTDENYPEEGSTVVVEGTFESYIDDYDGGTYYHLANATLE